MTPAEVPHDLYTEVATVVKRLVAEDAAKGVPEALVWHGRVTRKTVKRGTMTLAYGVTPGGIRTQLVSDGLVPDMEEDGDAAGYLRDRMLDALSETVVSAKSIMAWLQTTADRLGRAGLPYEFRTPTGSLVRQGYHTITQNRLVTLAGSIQLEEEVEQGPLSPRKCALAAAPNTIHAFDAAHLALTVNMAHAEGIRSFAMIHDSFGTHAGSTTLLSGLLRMAFVDIYSVDRLAEVADYVRSYAPHVDLPPLPERGTFDVSQVLEAPYFFS